MASATNATGAVRPTDLLRSDWLRLLWGFFWRGVCLMALSRLEGFLAGALGAKDPRRDRRRVARSGSMNRRPADALGAGAGRAGSQPAGDAGSGQCDNHEDQTQTNRYEAFSFVGQGGCVRRDARRTRADAPASAPARACVRAEAPGRDGGRLRAPGTWTAHREARRARSRSAGGEASRPAPHLVAVAVDLSAVDLLRSVRAVGLPVIHRRTTREKGQQGQGQESLHRFSSREFTAAPPPLLPREQDPCHGPPRDGSAARAHSAALRPSGPAGVIEACARLPEE